MNLGHQPTKEAIATAVASNETPTFRARTVAGSRRRKEENDELEKRIRAIGESEQTRQHSARLECCRLQSIPPVKHHRTSSFGNGHATQPAVSYRPLPRVHSSSCRKIDLQMRRLRRVRDRHHSTSPHRWTSQHGETQ